MKISISEGDCEWHYMSGSKPMNFDWSDADLHQFCVCASNVDYYFIITYFDIRIVYLNACKHVICFCFSLVYFETFHTKLLTIPWFCIINSTLFAHFQRFFTIFSWRQCQCVHFGKLLTTMETSFSYTKQRIFINLSTMNAFIMDASQL